MNATEKIQITQSNPMVDSDVVEAFASLQLAATVAGLEVKDGANYRISPAFSGWKIFLGTDHLKADSGLIVER